MTLAELHDQLAEAYRQWNEAEKKVDEARERYYDIFAQLEETRKQQEQKP